MLELVPTPIGNIGDISLRAIEALSEADILLCEDTRVTKKLINLLKDRYNTPFKENQQFFSLHSHNEDEFLNSIDKEIFDKNVVYVSDAGMPSVSDPAQKLIAFAQQNSIAYDVLPGANAALCAYVASGFVGKEMLFFGFLPHKGADRESELKKALNSGYVAVVYESVHRIEKLLDEIDKKAPTREIFVAKEISKRYQEYHKGFAKDIKKSLKNIKGE
ncbi:MAG: 16S rRNA (cytidine(1402)-2'-O)-methyltransferase, partial [Sulfurimonas sp.]